MLQFFFLKLIPVLMGSTFNRFFLIFAISISISFFCSCNGSDTILAGQSLFPNQTIISKEGNLELGFFSPPNSSNYYIGIRYKNIPVQTIVWVANRNHPIPSSFYNHSRLQMNNGSLNLIVNSERILMLARSSSATEAVILETGNFVLRNASGILWQSFDNPTDTWLPGGMVGSRWSTDVGAKLVSWRNVNDPATGDYSLGMEANGGSELFIKNNGSKKLWRSGILEGERFASLSSASEFYKFSLVTSEERVYLTYNVYNESTLVRIVLDHLGFMKHLVWSEGKQTWITLVVQPSDSCTIYARCGPNAVCSFDPSPVCRCLDGFVPLIERDWDVFDFSGGCRRIRPLQCDEENTRFMEVGSIRLPAYAERLEITRDGVCEFVCRVNCSCTAYAYRNGDECLLFMGELLDMGSLPENAGEALYVRMERPRKGKREVVLVALVVSIAASILLCSFCICYLRRKKLKKEEFRGILHALNTNEKCTTVTISLQGEEISDQYELSTFSFSSIAAWTNNFSTTSKLGEGGFGPVYKGELPNKQLVAVKKLSRQSGQGLEEFKNEIELIAKLQHRNLVGIVGCCVENDEKILVYEYMPNKSLDFFLFDPIKRARLSWRRRVHIIEGIAQGLLYLHHHSRLRIVHRDLKASNILLDAEMNAKISDFGMARIFGGDDLQLQAKTKRIVGTYGYMSPEYATKGLFSVKSDVFSFGVLMLEIISGKKNSGFYGSNCLSLLDYAWNMWKYGLVLELVDPTLEIPFSSCSTPLRYIQIALLCVEENPAHRPIMCDVLAMLNKETSIITSPQHPAFTVGRSLPRAHPTHNEFVVCSVNGLTVSHMEAR